MWAEINLQWSRYSNKLMRGAASNNSDTTWPKVQSVLVWLPGIVQSPSSFDPSFNAPISWRRPQIKAINSHNPYFEWVSTGQGSKITLEVHIPPQTSKTKQQTQDGLRKRRQKGADIPERNSTFASGRVWNTCCRRQVVCYERLHSRVFEACPKARQKAFCVIW